MDINKDTPFIDILKKHPKVVKKVLKTLNLPCLECRGFARETIEYVAYSNGLSVEEFLETIRKEMKDE